MGLKTNADLLKERSKVKFDVEEFTNFFYGGADKVAKKRFLGKLLSIYLRVMTCMNIKFIFKRSTSYRTRD